MYTDWVCVHRIVSLENPLWSTWNYSHHKLFPHLLTGTSNILSLTDFCMHRFTPNQVSSNSANERNIIGCHQIIILIDIVPSNITYIIQYNVVNLRFLWVQHSGHVICGLFPTLCHRLWRLAVDVGNGIIGFVCKFVQAITEFSRSLFLYNTQQYPCSLVCYQSNYTLRTVYNRRPKLIDSVVSKAINETT